MKKMLRMKFAYGSKEEGRFTGGHLLVEGSPEYV